jgi:hypothetical protein
MLSSRAESLQGGILIFPYEYAGLLGSVSSSVPGQAWPGSGRWIGAALLPWAEGARGCVDEQLINLGGGAVCGEAKGFETQISQIS